MTTFKQLKPLCIMTSLDDSYENLKLLAIKRYISNNCERDINNLKDLFASDINSPRSLSYISDLSSLIVVLEKRDVLSPINIKAFYIIYTILQLKCDTLDKHNELLKNTQDCLLTRNYEKEPNIQTPFTDSVLLPEIVVKIVCSQIGHSWKSLARYLRGIQECTIEQIEADRSIKTDETRARLVLEEFQQKMNPSELRMRLLNALKLVGRMDIHNQVVKNW